MPRECGESLLRPTRQRDDGSQDSRSTLASPRVDQVTGRHAALPPNGSVSMPAS